MGSYNPVYHFRLTQSEYDYSSYLCSVTGMSRSNLYRALVLLGPYPYYESISGELSGIYSFHSVPFMHALDYHKFTVEFMRQNSSVTQALRRFDEYFRGNYSYRTEQDMQLRDSLQKNLRSIIENLNDCAEVVRGFTKVAFTDANTNEHSNKYCGFAIDEGMREILQLKAEAFEICECMYLRLALRVFEEMRKDYFVQKNKMKAQGVETMPRFYARVIDPESVVSDLAECGKSFNSAVHFMNAFFDAPGIPTAFEIEHSLTRAIKLLTEASHMYDRFCDKYRIGRMS